MGVRRPEQGALTHYHSWSVTDLTGGDVPPGKSNTASPVQQEEGTFPSLPGNSAHETPSSAWTLLVFLRQTFVQNNPANFVLFLYKVMSLSFAVGPACGFLYSLFILTCKSSPIPK